MPKSRSSILSYIRSPPRSVGALPVDSSLLNYPRRVINSVFALVPCQPLLPPMKVIAVSLPALQSLVPGDVTLSQADVEADEDLISVLSGNALAGSDQFSTGWGHCYWGTQFGNYAGQLGDGAAMMIGDSQSGLEINLKGSGKTPFARGFDGRKVVRSSIREFLCSEAMSGLNIPTTRAGSVIMSETSKVVRDVSYSGRPIEENCAVVSRIAKTFFRFGSFESTDPQDSPSIRTLAEYVWNSHLKPMASQSPNTTHVVDSGDSHAASETLSGFMDTVIDRTAFLVSEWQAVGFVHGVMNTDNMSIIGDTIDYGPYGFMETYDPYYVPNSSDKFARYNYSQQPAVAAWNCRRLYEVLDFHLHSANIDTESLCKQYGWRELELDNIEAMFMERYRKYNMIKMNRKLGLVTSTGMSDDNPRFTEMHKQFFDICDFSAVDFTTAFRSISVAHRSNVEAAVQMIMDTFPSAERVVRLSSEGLKIDRPELEEVREFANTRLPELERAGITRSTIDAWGHKHDRIERFTNSYDQTKEASESKWREFIEKLVTLHTSESADIMDTVNPVYIPRQSHMQDAIVAVETNGDCDQVSRLLGLYLHPFTLMEGNEVYSKPDLGNFGVCLSCSS